MGPNIFLLRDHLQVILLHRAAVEHQLKHLVLVDNHARQEVQIPTVLKKDSTPILKIAINSIDVSMKMELSEGTTLSVEPEQLGINSYKLAITKMLYQDVDLVVNHHSQVHLPEVNNQAMVQDQEMNNLVLLEEALQGQVRILVNLLRDLIQAQLKLLFLLSHNKPKNLLYLLRHRRKDLNNHPLNRQHNLPLSIRRNLPLSIPRNFPLSRQLEHNQHSNHNNRPHLHLVANRRHNQEALSRQNLVATLAQKRDSSPIQITAENSIDA